ncbi:MAG: hypothetical protein HY782_07305 [Chloroflexi bacterium]|nr:hypothetical protein [Chloroflexota bacterium]
MESTETIESQAAPEGQATVANQPALESQPRSPDESPLAAIADKVRTDSQTLARLIPVEELGTLFPDETPDQIIGYLAELVKAESYQDVKVHVSPSGAAYLYSTTCLTPEAASEKALMGEVHDKIADKVRADSQELERLTAMKSLVELFPDVPPDQVEKFAGMMADDEKFQDIKALVGPTGTSYFYSETHMTANYAALLARIEAKNPYATIAETVREESRVYPRPTKVALFYEPLFQIDPDMMGTVVEGMLQREEYQDIKKVVASTGAVYLYSDSYMPAGQAEAIVQWEEVEKDLNP